MRLTKTTLRSLPVLATLGLLLAAPTASAAGHAGDLDKSFGDGGVAKISRPYGGSHTPGSFTGGNLGVTGTRPVLPGYIFTDPNSANTTNIGAAGFTSSGELDAGFGDGGIVDTGIIDKGYEAFGLPFGKTLVVGTSRQTTNAQPGATAVRLTSDGELDPSFAGGAGFIHVAAGNTPPLVTVAPDSSIVIASPPVGSFTDPLRIWKFTPDGTPDEDFGNGGKATPNWPQRDQMTDIAIDGRGRIVLSGMIGGFGSPRVPVQPAVYRLHGDGSRDRSFGDKGRSIPMKKLKQDTGVTYDVAVGIDNMPLATAIGHSGTYLFGLDKHGKLEKSFGDGGIANRVNSAPPYGLATQNARPVVMRSVPATHGGGERTRIDRLKRDGSIDRSFSGNGKVLVNGIGSPNSDVVIDSESRILFATFKFGGGSTISIVRLLR